MNGDWQATGTVSKRCCFVRAVAIASSSARRAAPRFTAAAATDTIHRA